MKKVMLLLSILLVVLVFACTACGKTSSVTPAPTSSNEQEEESDDSEGSLTVPMKSRQQENPPDEPAPEEPDKRSTTYGPSIFVIEASGSWQHEIDPGYYVNYECELYLDKIEPHNMHDDVGSYTGVFWLKLTLDTEEYFSGFLKDVPFVDISLDAEAQNGEMGVAYDAAVSLRDFEGIAALNLQVIAAGRNHVVGLCRDGRVLAAGNNNKGQCNVQDWTDIIAVAAGFEYTVGLRADGTVVATGSNNNGQCDVQNWSDIVAIYVGNTATDTLGVKADGTIVATGNLEGENYFQQIPSKADGMAKICPGWAGILVLMDDGSIQYIDKLHDMEGVEDWMGIVDVAIGTVHASGLLFDGTVVTAGRNTAGQNDVKDWTNIIAIAASNSNTAGLKADGTVVVAGRESKGQKDANAWEDIAALSVGPGYVIGLKIDGTVVVAGTIVGSTDPSVDENMKVLEAIASWHDIGPAS